MTVSNNGGNLPPSQQIKMLRNKFTQEQTRQGAVSKVGGKIVDGFKSTVLKPFGNQTSSSSIQEQLDKLEKTAAQVEKNGRSSDNPASQQLQAQIQKTDKNLDSFHKSNEMGGTISKTAVTTGAVVAGTALAPVTGGASLAVGVGIGTSVNMASNYVDKNTSDNQVTLNPLKEDNRFTKKDAIAAGANGAIAGAMPAIGGSTGNLAANALKDTLPQAAVKVVQNQAAGAACGSVGGFTGTVTKRSIEEGGINGKVLEDGAKAAGTGIIAGATGGTITGGLTNPTPATNIGKIGNTATEGVAAFGGTVAKRSIEEGEINGKVLEDSAQAASNSLVGGAVGNTASTNTKTSKE